MGACGSSENPVGGVQLVRVGYRSTTKPGADVDAIIEKSEKNNRKLKVGGALYYDPQTGKVHQILEGEERAVTRLLDKIIMDKRHRAIIMENMEQVKARRFQDWGGMKLALCPLLRAPKKGAVGYRMHAEWDDEEQKAQDA
mmetsp:Transcript_22777/g.42797  ORF Transcript_22777/g.42797 Transcript_22777/m.42797 type:complete len:141 (-) Transcript_22777:73-495(-)|eukprot:CAMPEP_0170186612 /NCGR_PEP_ID=MMETSP0040_2-20121228/39714_1 /TAXON_ID=641309 /ORGANISM="Lotharella oceanica, Strain CCMP622" /LENGTH=140 /DNA_ID=CAMNT_0010433425 /DNA_START=127 /DNA_END=549 /DNA_ORIENTATION=-